MLFLLNFVSKNYQRRCIIRFLSSVDELKSIKWCTLLVSRNVLRNFFLSFSVLVFGNFNSSFDCDFRSWVCSSSMLFCGSFESCGICNNFSDCIYIDSGSIFSILICWVCPSSTDPLHYLLKLFPDGNIGLWQTLNTIKENRQNQWFVAASFNSHAYIVGIVPSE